MVYASFAPRRRRKKRGARNLPRLESRGESRAQRASATGTRSRCHRGGRRVLLPLLDYLAALPAGDDPDAPLFPRSATATRTGTLSNRFRKILVAAGLAESVTHKSTGKRRDTAHESAELSFHSLRHSAVTFLKAAGVTNPAA